MMNYRYGTAGFRYNSSIIQDISFSIGKGVALCSKYTKYRIGVMITASHNKHTDNGVKIVDNTGHMVSSNLERLLENVVNNKYQEHIIDKPIDVIIGMDTRETGPNIKKEIVRGIKSICKTANIIDIGLSTTPLHHSYVNNSSLNYIEKYSKLLNNITNSFDCNSCEFNEINIDCANGVGTVIMNNILENIDNKLNIKLINTDIDNKELLNNKCGSDYVMTNGINVNEYKKNVLYSSFDGDADRIIFYFIDNNNNFRLLTGDYISALIALYIDNNKDKYSNCSKGVIHTGYSNGAFINSVNKYNVDTYCTATGVKHLHKKAEEYDIGIYFEANGHGTCLVKNNNFLNYVFNQIVGDAVATFIGVLFILNELKITLNDWYNLFDEYNYINKKVSVVDKSIYKTNDNQTKLLEPIEISQKLNDIFNKYSIRGFIRPSGTEDVVRIYVESKDSKYILETAVNEITDIL